MPVELQLTAGSNAIQLENSLLAVQVVRLSNTLNS